MVVHICIYVLIYSWHVSRGSTEWYPIHHAYVYWIPSGTVCDSDYRFFSESVLVTTVTLRNHKWRLLKTKYFYLEYLLAVLLLAVVELSSEILGQAKAPVSLRYRCSNIDRQ